MFIRSKKLLTITAIVLMPAFANAQTNQDASSTVAAQEQAPPKGYIVIQHDILDPKVAKEKLTPYGKVASPLLAQYGGHFLVLPGTQVQALEGGWAPQSLSIIEFPSAERARAFYFSKEYQAVLPIRLHAYKWTKGLLVEGAPVSEEH